MKATKMKATKLLTDTTIIEPRFDPNRVEALVLDELNVSRGELINYERHPLKVQLARVVIANIITEHCGSPRRSEQATRTAIKKQIGMRTHTSGEDLRLAIHCGRLNPAAKDAGFNSAAKFEGFIEGMLMITEDWPDVA
jgi:hypothetical protein